MSCVQNRILQKNKKHIYSALLGLHSDRINTVENIWNQIPTIYVIWNKKWVLVGKTASTERQKPEERDQNKASF